MGSGDKQKLLDLIIEAKREDPETGSFTEFLADFLIANGVTVRKWNSAKTPPKDWKGEGGYLTNYYVYTPDYGVDIGNYMGAAKRWLCMGMPCNVTHWMPLPEPPEEVCEE